MEGDMFVHAVRRAAFTACLLGLGWIVGTFTGPPPAGSTVAGLASMVPGDRGDWRTEAARTSVAGLGATLDWVLARPIAAAVTAAIVLVPWLIAVVISLIPKRVPKDPVRLFTVGQRSAASARAGGRCEMEGILYNRCRRPGKHGDHWYPHSKGGATNQLNHVWACEKCNLSKGARIPTFWETARLEWRRKRYFPPGEPIRPGARYRTY